MWAPKGSGKPLGLVYWNGYIEFIRPKNFFRALWRIENENKKDSVELVGARLHSTIRLNASIFRRITAEKSAKNERLHENSVETKHEVNSVSLSASESSR